MFGLRCFVIVEPNKPNIFFDCRSFTLTPCSLLYAFTYKVH